GDQVALVREGRVATVMLNRPDRRNSLSDAMLTELAATLTELRDDAEIRVVVVTGAPPVFSAGADAPLRSTMSPDEPRRAFLQRDTQFRRLFERATTLLESLEQATIVLLPGPALAKEVRRYDEGLAAKPPKPLAEVKARINAIARTGIPEVNAMTEGFLDRG